MSSRSELYEMLFHARYNMPMLTWKDQDLRRRQIDKIEQALEAKK